VLPDVPTLGEVGVPDYEVYEWNPVFAPAAAPADIVAQLSAAIRRVMALPEVRDRIASMGGEVLAATPQEAGAFVRAQTELWAKVIRQADIKPD
jgi:tripartite-type tricarboxylate transporter receptor subunit TctC